MKKWKFNHIRFVSTSTKPDRPVIPTSLSGLVTRTFSEMIKAKVKHINGLAARNGGRGLINYLKKVVIVASPQLSSSTITAVVIFCRMLSKLISHQGVKGAVLYLKAAHVLLMQSAAGNRIDDITDLKVRVNRTKGGGIPRFIPRQMRMRIREGDVVLFRVWSSLLSFYRVMSFPGKLSLSTITDKGVLLSTSFISEWSAFITDQFFPAIKGFFPSNELWRKIREYDILPNPFPILKAGPTTQFGDEETGLPAASVGSSSLLSLSLSSIYWKASPLYPVLLEYLSLIRASNLINRINWAASFVPSQLGLFSRSEERLGRLATKDEPAGKIRVFAMVDPWTQWIMRPIHDVVFALLRKLPQDGTFDQPKPANRLVSKLQEDLNRRKSVWVYSIDLSAATDRLPIALQVFLVAQLFSIINFGFWSSSAKRLSELWRDLLVGREYHLTIRGKSAVKPKRVSRTPNGIKVIWGLTKWPGKDVILKLTYSVGQPMGALSSWALLALTHHAIVQFAAFRVANEDAIPYKWFTKYAILGDDVVIGSRRVAKKYLEILQQIGVKAGLAKSVVAHNNVSLEFAKKYWLRGQRADPVPLKEMIAALLSIRLAPEYARRYGLTWVQLQSFYGKGYKVKSMGDSSLYNLPRRLAVPLVAASKPGGLWGVPDWMTWLSLYSSNDVFSDRNRIKIEDVRVWRDVLNVISNDYYALTDRALARFSEVRALNAANPLEVLGVKPINPSDLDQSWFYKALSIYNPVVDDKPPVPPRPFSRDGLGEDEREHMEAMDKWSSSIWRPDDPIPPLPIVENLESPILLKTLRDRMLGDDDFLDRKAMRRLDHVQSLIVSRIQEIIDLEDAIANLSPRAPQHREEGERDFSETVIWFRRWSKWHRPLRRALLILRRDINKRKGMELKRKQAALVALVPYEDKALIPMSAMKFERWADWLKSQQPIMVNPKNPRFIAFITHHNSFWWRCHHLAWVGVISGRDKVMAFLDGILVFLWGWALLQLPGVKYPYVPLETGFEVGSTETLWKPIEHLERGGRELYLQHLGTDNNLNGDWYLWLGGVFIILLGVVVYLYATSPPGPPEIVIEESLSLVDRHLAGYHGPLLPGEQETLQLMLEDRAFLDNLTLSPLSDLFVGAPW